VDLPYSLKGRGRRLLTEGHDKKKSGKGKKGWMSGWQSFFSLGGCVREIEMEKKTKKIEECVLRLEEEQSGKKESSSL